MLRTELVFGRCQQHMELADDTAAIVLDTDTSAGAVLLSWLFAYAEAAETPCVHDCSQSAQQQTESLQNDTWHHCVKWSGCLRNAHDVSSDACKAGIKVARNCKCCIGMCSTAAAALLTTVAAVTVITCSGN